MSDWTIKKLLNWSADYFKEKGIEQGRLESEILLAHLLQIGRLDLYLQFDRPMDPNDLSSYKALIKRRLEHEPVAYLVGKKEFWSRDFYVDKNVLIPRPETEHIIEVVLDHYENRTQDLSGFEVGVGSGCLSITLLSEFKNLNMSAVDVSEGALAIAQKNSEYHGVDYRLKLEECDFLKNKPTEKFDVIISNPPYISKSEMQTLDPTVKDHEPHLALQADDEGLAFYKALAPFVKSSLNEGGVFAVEVGETQADTVSKLFKDAGLATVAIKKDLAGHSRVVWGN